ncbi:hypothetical protein [Neisseria uirgultaei]|uniref:hypothetical protein n=1 Tax=Neisseria uirgultaei TaxID=2830646 RepID=UPI0026599021|nr:hypothetical protein [Neisseria uirgultaei]
MKLISFNKNQVAVNFNKNELYIIQAIMGEIYSEVCVDHRDFEIIHGIEKDEVLLLDKQLKELYDTLNKL